MLDQPGPAREVLSRLDVKAGHRLLYIADVRRQPSGDWLIERCELLGEKGRRIESLAVSEAEAAPLPEPERIYLAVASPLTPPRLLHPLLWHDAKEGEVLFLNSPRGRLRTNYLDYTTGRSLEQLDLNAAQRELLGKILGRSVSEAEAAAWAARSLAEEPTSEGPEDEAPRFLGEFELWSELGRGGMGVVYRAWQPSLGRQVALKKLQKTGDAKIESRFAREIRALGRVEHPHLVKIFTSGSEGDQWYYAMELLEGTPLSAVCDKLQTSVPSVTAVDLPIWRGTVVQACQSARQAEKPLGGQVRQDAHLSQREGKSSAESSTSENAGAGAEPCQPPPSWVIAQSPTPDRPPLGRNYVEHIAELLRQIAEAAHALHEAGIIHRDIKPGNIMVTADGAQAILIDPGLAKLADEVDGRLTRTRQFVGTLRYASPEQVLAVGGLDRRSDVYSLGATLWELLTLRPLYGADEQTPTPELMRRIQYHEPERVRKHHPGVSADLDAIVLKCLEKDPQRRYATAAELARDLRRFLAGEPVQARPISQAERCWRWCRRNPARVAVAGLGLLATMASVGLFIGWLFAVQQATSANNLRSERDRTRKAWGEAEKYREEAELLSAQLLFKNGVALCEEGEAGRGMLWMARSLARSPDSAAGLQRTVRTALPSAAATVHALEAVFSFPNQTIVTAFSPDGKTLFLGGKNARLVDVDTGRPRRRLFRSLPAKSPAVPSVRTASCS